MAVGEDIRRIGTDLPVSKIPKPAPSLTPRARTPPRTQTSTTPSRIPQANTAARSHTRTSLETTGARPNSQRSVTPPPNSRPSEIPMLRQRVAPGREMTTPPMPSKTRAVSARRSSTPTLSSTNLKAEPAKLQRASVDSSSKGLRRTRSAGIVPVRSTTPRPKQAAAKISETRGSTVQARGTANISAPRRKTPPPSTGFAPPVRRTSPSKTGGPVPSRLGDAKSSTKGEAAPAPVLEQILQENRELRDAFNLTSERLSALEDGQNRFFHEGIYDLVNAVHSPRKGQAQTYLPESDAEHFLMSPGISDA